MQTFKRGARALGWVVMAVGLFVGFDASAQEAWPSKPIRLVVPFTPGGVTDTSGRLIAEHLGKRLGQQVVIDNKPGASGNIGTSLVAQSAPDGYTLVLGFDGTMVINPHVFAKVPFDTLKDFAPVGKIGDAVLILVSNPGVPARTLQDVIALSKTQPGGLSYGTSGTGGTPHIAGELFKQRTGANLTHIPYKGGGQALTDLLGGTIPLVYTAVAGAVQHVKSGKLHGVAVSSAQRAPSLPDVPTFIESGVADFDINSWVGLLAPAKTPQAIVDNYNATLNKAMVNADLKDRFNKLGVEPHSSTPAEFRTFLNNEKVKYSKLIADNNIKAE